MLVPLDIRHKTFKTGVSWFNKQEVQEFLSQVEKDFSQLYRDNKELQEKVERLSEEVDRYRSTGRQLEQALTLAQKTAEDVKNTAKHEAETIVENARVRAEQQTSESKQLMRSISSAYIEFKSEFKAYLTTFLNLLENMDSSLFDKARTTHEPPSDAIAETEETEKEQ